MSNLNFRPLKAEDVEVRVGTCSEKGVSLLLYKTSRTDMALLDETVGPENWQCDYRAIDGKLFCGIGCRFKDGEWVWKWDTGTPSNMEAQKGEASDAFKRAGFKWGIGRELYTSPFVWVSADKCSVKQGRNGKQQCYDDFRCTEMEVDGGQIVKLTIANMSRKGKVVYGTAAEEPTVKAEPKPAPKKKAAAKEEKEDDPELKKAKARMWKALSKWAELHGREPEDVLEGVKKDPSWAETADFFNYRAADFEAAING